MRIKNKLDKRIQLDIVISKDAYAFGLLGVVQILIDQLEVLMTQESRFSGIVLSYFNSIRTALKKISENDKTEDDIEIYGKILYLCKPMILREYDNLCKRHVTRADSMISVLHKILEILMQNLDEDFVYMKEVKTINKVITKLFDNIRNGGKNSKMKYLSINLDWYFKNGLIGKIILSEFNILEEEEKRKKFELNGSGIRINEAEGKISEVSWTKE